MQRLMARLRFLDCHEAFYIIKNSLYIPKLLFILRSTPLYNSEKLAVLDKCFYDNISVVLNVGLDEKKMMQISLPVKFGGFGIRSLHVLALPAFLSSYYGALNIMNTISPPSMIDEPYHEAIAAEEFWKNLPGITDLDYPLKPNVQKQWDTPISKQLLIISWITRQVLVIEQDSLLSRRFTVQTGSMSFQVPI